MWLEHRIQGGGQGRSWEGGYGAGAVGRASPWRALHAVLKHQDIVLEARGAVEMLVALLALGS